MKKIRQAFKENKKWAIISLVLSLVFVIAFWLIPAGYNQIHGYDEVSNIAKKVTGIIITAFAPVFMAGCTTMAIPMFYNAIKNHLDDRKPKEPHENLDPNARGEYHTPWWMALLAIWLPAIGIWLLHWIIAMIVIL